MHAADKTKIQGKKGGQRRKDKKGRGVRRGKEAAWTKMTTAEGEKGKVTIEKLTAVLREDEDMAPIQHLEIEDISGGCGQSFMIKVVTEKFTKTALLQRHRMIHNALGEMMPLIHALQLKCLTPEAYERLEGGKT